MTCEVYFAHDGRRIKIGHSTDVMCRMKQVGTHLDADPVVLVSVPGSAKAESAIRRSLQAFRIRREWFRDCPEVRAVMEDVRKNGVGKYEPAPVVKRASKPANVVPLFTERYPLRDDIDRLKETMGLLEDAALQMLRTEREDDLGAALSLYRKGVDAFQAALRDRDGEYRAAVVTDTVAAVRSRLTHGAAA